MDEQTERMAALFKALSEPVRLRLLEKLPQDDHPGEISVCELACALDIPQPNVSHHLSILKAAGLVRCSKESCKCFYSVNKDAVEEAISALRSRLGPEISHLEKE